MFALLPFFVLILFSLIFYQKKYGFRDSLLLGAIVWGILLTLIVELLSVYKILTYNWLLVSWGIVFFILFFYYYCTPKRNFITLKNFIFFNKYSLWFRIMFLLIFVIVASVLAIAIVAAPNNGDSLTYHLSRIMHWQQNQSVLHYPTNVQRELYLSPWAEFAIMNFQILSGGDLFANLIQWFSMVGSIIGITLIGKQLGAKIRVQIFAAVVTATIPMGILQASSTQNDYVFSFWLVCFIYLMLSILQKGKMRSLLFYSVMIGGSLGLAFLTKGTAYVILPPFFIWLILITIKVYKSNSVKIILLILFIALLINLGHYIRNFNLYGSPLGSSQEGGSSYRFANDIFTLPSFVSSTTRNIGLHLSTPLSKINSIIESQIFQLHKIIGLDINDPRTTWGGEQKFQVPYLSTNEDIAGNPIHLFLIVVSYILVIFIHKVRKNKDLITYSVFLLSSFLLFCFVFRWQYWHSRLHLPIFVLYSPFIAIVLSRTLNKTCINLIISFLIIFSFYWVLFNSSRPILGAKSIFTTDRIDQYFINDLPLLNGYKKAASYINQSQCNQVGIIMGSAEYPLWELLQRNTNNMIRVEHVNVSNISKNLYSKYPFYSFLPCVVVSMGVELNEEIYVKDNIYQKVWIDGPVSFFVKT